MFCVLTHKILMVIKRKQGVLPAISASSSVIEDRLLLF